MDKALSFVKRIFENSKAMLLGEYLKDAELEDTYSYRLMLNHLILKNAQRAILMTVFELIIGIITLVTVGSLDQSGMFRCVGAFILIASTPVFFYIFFKEIQKKNPDYSFINKMLYIFWGVFSIGGATAAVSEFLGSHELYLFFIFFGAVLVVPIVNPSESLFFAGITLIELIIFGSAVQSGVLFWVGAVLAILAYLWISAVNCCCFSSMWISKRRLEISEERCAQISKKDTLTGLLNKTGLASRFNEKYGKNSSGKKIAVLMIDVDNFRAYNHLYGHENSDNCLYKICNYIKITSKQYTDIISRFGGDDIVLVVENMSEVAVVTLAEQLRRGVETMALNFDKSVVTISVGISQIRELNGSETYSSLLNEADTQLMIAKRAGRNCVGYRGRPFISESRKIVR